MGSGLFDVKASTPSLYLLFPGVKYHQRYTDMLPLASERLSPEGECITPHHHWGASACPGSTRLLKVGSSEPTVKGSLCLNNPDREHMCMLSRCSCVRLCGTPWTVARHASLSMGFSRQEYWIGLPCPLPGDIPAPRIKPLFLLSPALGGGFFTTSITWEALAGKSPLKLGVSIGRRRNLHLQG